MGYGGTSWKQPRTNFNFGWFEMNIFHHERQEESARIFAPSAQDFRQVANDICENALNDARAQLHPLMRNTELRYLRKRGEFVQAWKLALERRIAQKLASSQPGVQAVFQFDDSWLESRNFWDGSIHLLVKVPRLSNAIKTFEKKLGQNLTYCLQQLGWSRFRRHQSILEVQQVTSNELRHGIGYGAMFHAVYSVPVKVWPLKRSAG